MNLYEVTNGYVGRSYAWVENEGQARRLARESFAKNFRDTAYNDNYWSNLKAKFLFSEHAQPFATEQSDSGFEKPRGE